MKLIIILFVLNVFLCYVDCKLSDEKSYEEYQLPEDVETKSLRVESIKLLHHPTVFFVTCYNYNSLKQLKLRRNRFKPKFGIKIHFENCFNDATTHENYNEFAIIDPLENSFSNFTGGQKEKFFIDFGELTLVNCSVLFNNFNFALFRDYSFSNIACKTSNFVNRVKCKSCQFNNNIELDFNEFNDDMSDAKDLHINFNKLINFNKVNLKKFDHLDDLRIVNFTLDDYNTFNVPSLFEFNSLGFLMISGSDQKITLHEDVFKGQTYLSNLHLEGLHLDYIPEHLFADLESVTQINLISNNIKTFHPTTFANAPMLSFVRLNGNPIFMGPQNEIQQFSFNSYIGIHLMLENFTIHTVDIFEKLLNNPKIQSIFFKSIVMDPINIEDFIRTNVVRYSKMHVTFEDTKRGVGLDFNYIKSNSIPIKYARRMEEPTNVLIKLPIHERYCTECWMVKNFLYQQLTEYTDFAFYFAKPGVAIQPVISCDKPDKYFEVTFEQNCPANCACKYNPIRKEIAIDCSNKNLTELPVIPYPEQYQDIDKIDLLFENNSLSVLSFENQNNRVVERLTGLWFRNNQIVSVAINESPLRFLQILDLCENPLKSNTTIAIAVTGLEWYVNVNNMCKYGRIDPKQENQSLLHKLNQDDLNNKFLNKMEC